MRRHTRLTLAAALVAVSAIATVVYPSAAEVAVVVPAPMTDLPPGSATSAVLVLAGGCFWGVQGVYQHVTGVTNAVSGYAGGEKKTAQYDTVGSGRTGHAESVQITYDPRRVSYGRLLQIFFSVVHDPTQVNRQGPDTGPQYRSAIFPSSEQQAEVAKAYIAQLDQTKVFKKPIATKIEPDHLFYPAEGYHQDYLVNNPRAPYIVVNDLPKVGDLKRLFPELFRPQPVLVGSASRS